MATRTPASGLGRLVWTNARLTLFLCQARRGQTTLPFSAFGSQLGRERPGEGPNPASLLGDSGGQEPVFIRWGRGGWRECTSGIRIRYSGQGLEERPTSCQPKPSWCVGSWHCKRPGHFPDKARKGGSPLLPGATCIPFTHKWWREGHIPTSYARNVAPQAEDWGGGASWGLEAGEARKTLQALREKLRKTIPKELGTRYAPQQQVPLQGAGSWCRDEVGHPGGGPSRMCPLTLPPVGLLGAGDRCDRGILYLGVTSTISSFTAFTLGPKGRGAAVGPQGVAKGQGQMRWSLEPGL